jgi:hypothetical protein
MQREGIASLADFATMAAEAEQPVITPDEGLAGRLSATGLITTIVAAATAADYARIGHRRFLAGERADLATLDANYLRRSDAELFSTPKVRVPPQR